MTTNNDDNIIRGTVADDTLDGTFGTDIFDADAGGNDTLRGGLGDDVYWLGRGTGHDRIEESYYNSSDRILIKEDISAGSVRLRRIERDLHVQLLGYDGITVTDSLTVVNYYVYSDMQVEYVLFTDGSGTMWTQNRFPDLGRVDTSSSETLLGREIWWSGTEDDVYWLGVGTGHDRIVEHGGNDEIRIKSGISEDSVRLRRSEKIYMFSCWVMMVLR